MPNAFRSHVSELATSLVESILAAARSVPLEELWADPRRANGEPHRNGGGVAIRPPAVNSSADARGRSTQAAAKTLELVVLLLRGQPGGMRAEHLRKKLGVSKPEITRALKQGLETKKIVSKGERRATTYFAAAS
jgi:uncharacterized membrane protein